MRKILVLLLLSNFVIEMKAQGKWGNDSVSCITNLSLYREYYKQKNYDDFCRRRSHPFDNLFVVFQRNFQAKRDGKRKYQRHDDKSGASDSIEIT